MTLGDRRTALRVVAGAGTATALAVGLLLPRDRAAPRAEPSEPSRAAGRGGAATGRTGFGRLGAIGMLDNAKRPAFLLDLPFLLGEKGAVSPLVGPRRATVASAATALTVVPLMLAVLRHLGGAAPRRA